MIQLVKKTFQAEQKNRLELLEEHLTDPVVALAKALECLETAHWGWHLVSQFVVAKAFCLRNGVQRRCCEFFAKMWEGPYWEEVWLFLDR